MKSKHLALLLLCIGALSISAKAQCSPFQSLGTTQFFDNSGVPLTNGVLYSFQAGTSTQQATFTDSTCTVQNVNPITMTTGARVNIWLTTGNFYKFQLCLQNDGSTCAPADVLFSVDQVPGGASGGGGGGGPPFTTGSPNPATTGILRCASGDQCVVFRNAANSANLAIAKDSSDVLSWASGAMKFPETACSASSLGFDYWCADSSSHHWKWTGNGGGQFFSPGIATAAASGNVAKFASNGIDVVDGGNPLEAILGWGVSSIIISNGATSQLCVNLPNAFCPTVNFTAQHTIIRFDYQLVSSPSGCSTSPQVGIYDFTAASNLYTTTITNSLATGYIDSGALSLSLVAGHKIGVGILTSSVGCGVTAQVSSLGMVYQ